MILRASLPDDDVASEHLLAAETLDAEAFDSESRPFFELPPAFLCAMPYSLPAPLIEVISTSVKPADAPVRACSACGAELDDRDLVAAALGDDFRLHLAARYERRADIDGRAFADHQHLVELDGVAHRDIELLDADTFALLGRYCLPPVRKTAYTSITPNRFGEFSGPGGKAAEF